MRSVETAMLVVQSRGFCRRAAAVVIGVVPAVVSDDLVEGDHQLVVDGRAPDDRTGSSCTLVQTLRSVDLASQTPSSLRS